MATHPGMLLAYDDAGNVVATLDYLVHYDTDHARTPLGLVDFAGLEESGGELLDVWAVSDAKGSKSWPEYLGAAAHDFRVELAGPAGRRHIAALVHKTSGVRRERAVVGSAIASRVAAAAGGPADIRDLVGGPTRYLELDAEGRTLPRREERVALPVVGVRHRGAR